ncbi:hypothetical protein CBR_g51903 [Chara braunii]|uniref:Uncharacterized protein n=1 Tax=Chara braunii TaxID=69332 RepID=A0A388M973_CHABU|nr:hypothetical protein CBR_g51903 [Chara braunii]|eukprot:GBG91100.1 hypothetical protein CBR_g51903 [Chara braunii]
MLRCLVEIGIGIGIGVEKAIVIGIAIVQTQSLLILGLFELCSGRNCGSDTSSSWWDCGQIHPLKSYLV